MKTPPLEIQETPKKEFNPYLAVGKVLVVGLAIGATLFTARAMFTDQVLENLEKNYTQSLSLHTSATNSLASATKVERESADNACNSFKALKSYKESRKYSLKNDYNPCVELKAPQEGF